MSLLKYLPVIDLRAFKELYFDIKGTRELRAIQLEVKDAFGAKIIDETIPVSIEYSTIRFTLDEICNIAALEKVSEICFTVFINNSYIKGKNQEFELRNVFFQ